MGKDFLPRLPDEVLLDILVLLDIRDLLSCTATCNRLHTILDTSVWKVRCLNDFEHWDASHELSKRILPPLGDTDWKTMYMERHLVNVKTQQILNSILSSQAGRLDKISCIAPYGDDVKDILLENIATPSSAPDVLARRWYSRALFSHLQRTKAIDIWSRLANGEPVPLLRALLCFDNFILGERALSFHDASATLDRITSLFRSVHTDWAQYDIQKKACSIAQFLLDRNLVGLEQLHDYYDLENSLISTALSHPKHPSLPLISTVIYCCIAQRLGLNAKPCGFPTHVYAIVFVPDRLDNNDSKVSALSKHQGNKIYLDPFRSAQQVPEEQLLELLSRMDIHASESNDLLSPAKDVDIVVRCGRNIFNAVQQLESAERDYSELRYEPSTARYASVWSRILLSEGGNSRELFFLSRRRHLLPHLLKLFEDHHPFDASLIQDYICPLFDTSPRQGLLYNHIRETLIRDSMPIVPKRRNDYREGQVKYCIGQMFQHRRYEYEGVIYGWDVKCEMSEDWIQVMRVSELARGKQQPFYHILADDATTRYVAEDNIKIIKPTNPVTPILRNAGKYFRSWNSQTHTFVSNIRDEYPDD